MEDVSRYTPGHYKLLRKFLSSSHGSFSRWNNGPTYGTTVKCAQDGEFLKKEAKGTSAVVRGPGPALDRAVIAWDVPPHASPL